MLLPARYPLTLDDYLARRRRAVLDDAEIPTYLLQGDEDEPAVLCLCCGRRTTHPADVAALYCGQCHDWHLPRPLPD
jgi:hypothetical protein